MTRGVRTAKSGSESLKDLEAGSFEETDEMGAADRLDIDSPSYDDLLAKMAKMQEQIESMSKTSAPSITVETRDPLELRALTYAKVRQEARDNRASTTIKGGKFLVNNEWVNAFGDVIDPETGKVLEQRHKPIDGSMSL